MAEEEETVGEAGEQEAAGQRELTEEEIAMLEQQMRDLTVTDLLTQSVVSVLNLTARRIGKEDEIDLDQARTGIEAVRALLPLLPEEIASEVRDPLSQLQMLYVQKSGAGDPGDADDPGEGSTDRPGNESGQTDEPKGPDSGLWTPPGT